MDIKFRYLPDSPPVFDAAKTRARWAAAKADYLAGGSGPEVCERHGLTLRTFRHRAKQEGWRRADQPAPFVAPTVQDAPLVIPDAPTDASRDAPEQPPAPPLTASEMVDKAWSMLQAAVAAGQLIQARGWLRLYKELKLHVPFEEIEAREAERAAAAKPLSPPPPPEPDPDLAPPLHCFSPPECNPADDLARLVATLKSLTGKAERALTDEALALRLHCFSDAGRSAAGPGP